MASPKFITGESYGGYRVPRVVADLENRPVELVEVHHAAAHRMRAGNHRPQLVHSEAAAVHADPLLREEGRPSGHASDRQRRKCDQRRRDGHERRTQENVDRALEQTPGSRNLAIAANL